MRSHVSCDQDSSCLGYVGDYTSRLYSVREKAIIRISINQPRIIECHKGFFYHCSCGCGDDMAIPISFFVTWKNCCPDALLAARSRFIMATISKQAKVLGGSLE